MQFVYADADVDANNDVDADADDNANAMVLITMRGEPPCAAEQFLRAGPEVKVKAQPSDSKTVFC